MLRAARSLEALRADARFAFRYFGRNKLTVAIIVSVFALGIGANTTLLTGIQSQFQRPAPAVPDEGQVRVWGEQRATTTGRWLWRGFTYAELRALAARRETFSDVAGWIAHDVVLNAADSIGPRGVRAHFVTPRFFAALGVRVAAGTDFTAPDDAGADMSAVMSFAMAEQLYGTAANAVGQRIVVNDVAVRVVGLAPRAFQGAVRHLDNPALWIPVSARADIDRVPVRWLEESASFDVLGRLAPGVAEEQAASVARTVLARTLPDSAGRVGMTRRALVMSLHAMDPQGSEEVYLIVGLLGFAGVLLLLITCTNVSSLMVSAAVARRHEIALRLSLGASRARIVRQMLTETTLLAVAGGAAGLLVSWWLLMLVSGGQGSVEGQSVMPDANTFAYTMALAVGTGILFGLSPALHATRGGVSSAMRDSGSTGASSRSRLHRGFVVAQIVFSQPLLLMLGVTLSAVLADLKPTRRDVSERVVRAQFRPLRSTGTAAQQVEALDVLIPGIAAHPQVAAVVPEASWVGSSAFRPSGDDTAATAVTLTLYATAPGRFALLDIPILLGRDVAVRDTAVSDVPLVVGSDLARTLWGSAHPIGRTLVAVGRDSVRMTVVGVYDATQTTHKGTPRVYTAHRAQWRRSGMLLVRTRGPAEPFIPELRSLIRDRSPGLPLTDIETIARAEETERVETLAALGLVGVGGTVALLLACLGLYGVIALSVRQRTREIGIRIALGATPGRVSQMILGSGVRVALLALAIGLPLSMALLRFALSQEDLLVPNVNSWLIGAAVGSALLIVAAAATWVPARRASLVDPATTLRIEQ